ncbi:MAG: hypothetical protein K2G99_02435 [Desulfovibrio sp.]|nr:hypothetical protein [Desulfovibrio sp.]
MADLEDMGAVQGDIPLPGFMPEEEAGAGHAGGEAPGEAAPQAVAPATDTGQGPDAARLEAHLREHEAAQRARWNAQVEAWREEVAADPELGGERFEASVARAQLALGRFDEGGRIGRLLEASGYGNHPDVLRFFNRLADAVMEDVPAPGSAGGGLAPLEERMYPGWHS